MGERGATDVWREEETTGVGAPARILLASDGSKGSELAAKTAAELSRKFGSSLYLIHVMPVSSFHSDFGPKDSLEEDDTLTIYVEDAERAQDLLEKQVRQLEDEGVAVEKAHLRTGEPDAEIVTFAEEIEADLVVVGSRGTGAVERSTMGSVSESIVRHAHCPVLVVREQEHTNYGRRA